MVDRILVPVCVVALAVPAVLAEKEKPSEEKVYTTEDLERLYGNKTAKPKRMAMPATKMIQPSNTWRKPSACPFSPIVGAPMAPAGSARRLCRGGSP